MQYFIAVKKKKKRKKKKEFYVIPGCIAYLVYLKYLDSQA